MLFYIYIFLSFESTAVSMKESHEDKIILSSAKWIINCPFISKLFNTNISGHGYSCFGTFQNAKFCRNKSNGNPTAHVQTNTNCERRARRELERLGSVRCQSDELTLEFYGRTRCGIRNLTHRCTK